MNIILIYLYIFLGFYLMGRGDHNYGDLYILIMCFMSFKIVTNYRACSVAYAECKIRRVKRTESYVNKFLDPIVDVRYTNHIYLIVPLTMFILYNYLIINNNLKRIINNLFNHN